MGGQLFNLCEPHHLLCEMGLRNTYLGVDLRMRRDSPGPWDAFKTGGYHHGPSRRSLCVPERFCARRTSVTTAGLLGRPGEVSGREGLGSRLSTQDKNGWNHVTLDDSLPRTWSVYRIVY